jgi:hypothetical protein
VVGFRTLLCSEQRGGVMPLSPSFGGWWRGGGPQPPLLSMGEADAIGDCGESALSLSLWMWRQLQRLGRDRPAPPLVPTTDSPFDFACV